MTAPILVVQHAAVCPPGRVGAWLTEAGCALDVIRPYAGESQPDDLSDHAGLVVLGGEMGAYDDHLAPWLPATRTLLAHAVQAQRPTLAICLGHQLLSVACGGRVARSAAGQQGGAVPVGLTPAADTDPLFRGVAAGAVATHWNNDLVTSLPPGAVEVARTPAGVQAMRVGERVWVSSSIPRWTWTPSGGGRPPTSAPVISARSRPRPGWPRWSPPIGLWWRPGDRSCIGSPRSADGLEGRHHHHVLVLQVVAVQQEPAGVARRTGPRPRRSRTGPTSTVSFQPASYGPGSAVAAPQDLEGREVHVHGMVQVGEEPPDLGLLRAVGVRPSGRGRTACR